MIKSGGVISLFLCVDKINKKCYFIYRRFVQHSQTGRRQNMKNIPIETKCKIGNQILQILQRNEIAAGSKIDIHIELLKNGAIKKIELKEGE